MKRLRLLVATVCLVLAGAGSAWGAAKIFTVNSTADVANSPSTNTNCPTTCTLRAAIQASNNNNGADTINIPTAGVYSLTIAGRGEDAAATGDLDITDAVTITGGGAGSVFLDGNGVDRVFDVFANGTTNISGVTIRNGNPGNAGGGGIFTGGTGTNVTTLNLSKVIVTQNTASDFGGGIVNRDNVSLTDVTISNNLVSGAGGGLYTTGGTATLDRVTLSGNSADAGGAIESDFDVSLTNVTISGNTGGSGAAIMHNSGTATLVNVTIGDNTALQGGGAFFNLGDSTFKYTIFSHSPANETCFNFGTTFTSGGHNIDVGTSCGLTGTGDRSSSNPLLAPLQSNGGPTQTRALFTGSPAIDAGAADCPPPTCDQRGPGHCSTTITTACCKNTDCSGSQTCVGAFSRPLDGNGDTIATCDIGAFESNGTPPPPTTTTSTTSSTTTSSTTTSTTTTSTTTTRPPTTTSSTTSTTTATTTSSTTTTIQCGDVNGDRVVDIGDALVTAKYAVGGRVCGQAPFTHPEVCDVNPDSHCDIGDALKMAKCAVGQISCAFTCVPFSCP